LAAKLFTTRGYYARHQAERPPNTGKLGAFEEFYKVIIQSTHTHKKGQVYNHHDTNEVPNPSFIILCVLRLVVVFYHLYLFPLLLREVISCRDPGGSAPRDISQRLRATVSSGRTGGPCVEDS